MYQTIEEYLKEFGIPHNSTEGKWFNSDSYYKVQKITVKDNIENYNLVHTIEFKTSEYLSPSPIYIPTNLNSIVNVHTEIELDCYSTKNFKIEKINYIVGLFNSLKTYQVKSKNNILKSALEKSPALKDFFQLFSSDSEFDPVIKTIIKDHTTKIFIDFQCKVLTPAYIKTCRKLSVFFNEIIID